MDTCNKKTANEIAGLHERTGSAYDSLFSLFDEGTFAELGRLVKHSTTRADDESGNEFEGVVTGYGAIDGRLVFAFAQDSAKMKGAMSASAAAKIVTLYTAAMKSGAPVVAIYDCAGAKVLEGTAVLDGFGRVLNACAAASGVIPQIAIAAGNVSGCTAIAASMADVVIGAESAKFYIGTPFVLSKDCADAGSIKNAAATGSVSLVASDVTAAVAAARKVVSMLPSNNSEGIAYNETSDTLNRTVAFAGSISEKVSEISDSSSVIELGSAYAPEMFTALATVGGITCGFAANNAEVKSGKITPDAAKKAAKFVSFCDSFNIPVVTLVDSEGTGVCAKCENSPYAASLARLACAYASSNTPKVTVVTGKAYGSSFVLMGSRSLGADVEYALPDAKISILSPEAALEFVYGEEIRSAENFEEAEKAAQKDWDDNYASPCAAARCGAVDDVIDASELRMRIASALEMLSAKSDGFAKKHGNLPL